MFSAERRLPPMWRTVAWRTCLAFGLLYSISGAIALCVVIRHHTHGYHDILSRLTADIVDEYADCGGRAAAMKHYFEEDADEHGSENVFLMVSDGEGREKVGQHSREDVAATMLKRANGSEHTYRIVCDGKNGQKKISVRVRRTELPDGCILSVGYNVTRGERNAIRVGTLIGLTFLLTLAVGMLVGVVLARRFTAPLRSIAKAARRFAGGDYSARVSVSKVGRELADLENAFNAMGEENEKTLNELRTLADNIAHDLRTPLTRLRAAAEIEATGGELRRPLAETVAEETSAMLDMINVMLEISQTNFRIDHTPREDVDLVGFVRDMADLYSALAEDDGIALEVSLPTTPMPFSGHKGKLQQLFGNLFDNAVKFSPHGGRISATLSIEPPRFTIANSGAGIAADDVPFVFRRFWRADSSRSLPGNGLGLALVKAIATSYGWRVDCVSVPGGETAFTVYFT